LSWCRSIAFDFPSAAFTDIPDSMLKAQGRKYEAVLKGRGRVAYFRRTVRRQQRSGTLDPGSLNSRGRKHREKQNGGYRVGFHIRADRCSGRHIKRLGHIPVDTLFQVKDLDLIRDLFAS
jgi:hypothetical protein